MQHAVNCNTIHFSKGTIVLQHYGLYTSPFQLSAHGGSNGVDHGNNDKKAGISENLEKGKLNANESAAGNNSQPNLVEVNSNVRPGARVWAEKNRI